MTTPYGTTTFAYRSWLGCPASLVQVTDPMGFNERGMAGTIVQLCQRSCGTCAGRHAVPLTNNFYSIAIASRDKNQYVVAMHSDRWLRLHEGA